jgi:hypothetical protein
MSTTASRISIAITVWVFFTLFYIACQLSPALTPVTGYLSLIGEAGLDLVCVILLIWLWFKIKYHTLDRWILGCFFLSFLSAFIADGSYNVILNIMSVNHFPPYLEMIFDIPFLLFLVFQAIAWFLVALIMQHKNQKQMHFQAYIPVLIAGLFIFMAFIVLPNWQIHYSSPEGLFNIADTLVEIVLFMLAAQVLFTSKDRTLGFLTSGSLIIIASDLVIRFYEIENTLLPGSLAEAAWILGLLLFALGLLEAVEKDRFQFIREIRDWNSIKVQSTCWVFVIFLIALSVILISSAVFSKLGMRHSFYILITVIVFAILSTLISKIIAPFLVRPMRRMLKLIAEHEKYPEFAIKQDFEPVSTIKEFNEMGHYLRKGLSIIKSKSVKDRATFDALMTYLNRILDPLVALRSVTDGIKGLPETDKKMLMATTESVIQQTQELLQTLYPQKKETLEAHAPAMIIVDDNAHLNTGWAKEAIDNHIDLTIFQTAEEFRRIAPTLDKNTILCFDLHLANNKSGIKLSKWAYFRQGFKHIYLITADPKPPKQPRWILDIIDKSIFRLSEVIHGSTNV